MYMNKSPSPLNDALRSNWHSFIHVGIFSFFINLIMLVPPLYMLQIYDRVMVSRSQETLIMLTAVLIWMFATLAILELVRSRVLSRLSNRLDQALTQRIYQGMLAAAAKQAGRASSQPLHDLSSIRQYFSNNGIYALFDTPWVPVYLAILFLFDPLFGWFAVAAAVTVVILALINEFSSHGIQKQAVEQQIQAQQLVDTQLRNAEVARAMGMQNALHQHWSQAHESAIDQLSRASERSNFWANNSKTIRLLFQSLMLGLGAYLAINNHITAGMVIAGSIIMGRALAPLDQLIGSWKSLSNARLAQRRLDDFFSTQEQSLEQMPLPDIEGAISVHNAILIPPGSEEPSLKGVAFSATPGEAVAIIGPSGAGKSTLVKAILGIWPLSAGDIRFDQADIKQWDMSKLGPQLGYLPQDVELFAGTIAENVARFSAIDNDKVIKAAKLAGVDTLIKHLPEGYNTQIGIAGSVLSGGQRQRIGLARALYNDPKIVVLDEPNASLDDQGEQALLAACKQLKHAGTTVIFISHRQNILQLADKILVLDNGKQQLFGPAEAVLNRLAAKANDNIAAMHSVAAQG